MKRDSNRIDGLSTNVDGSPRRDTGLTSVALDAIHPDPANRPIDETDEDFQSLLDSIRVMGILVPLHVHQREAGSYQLLDGERRWRVARKVGLATVPCEVWPAAASRSDMAAAGLALNEHRKAHSCLSVARRLRQMKNQFGESHEELARRVGMPLPRVKWYLNLFNSSDNLLSFFESQDVPLKTAVEFVRYEKALGEVVTRRLLQRHRERPFTASEVETLRKRRDGEGTKAKADSEKRQGQSLGFAGRVEAAFRRDRELAIKELEAVADRLGFFLVAKEASGSSET